MTLTALVETLNKMGLTLKDLVDRQIIVKGMFKDSRVYKNVEMILLDRSTMSECLVTKDASGHVEIIDVPDGTQIEFDIRSDRDV